MSRFFFASLVLVATAGTAFAQETISPGYRARLTAAPRETATAIVMLKGADPFATEPLHERAGRRRVEGALRARFAACSRAIVHDLARLGEEARQSRSRGQTPARDLVSVEKLWAINSIIVKATGRTLLDIADRPDVERVIPDRPRTLLPAPPSRAPSREQGPFTYGLLKMQVDRVHRQLSLFGEGVRVGHLDTGVDATHPDLRGRVKLFRNFVANGGDTSTPVDDHGHGTHTAGTILGGSSSGTAIGVAPRAMLICGKIYSGSGQSTDAETLAGMSWICDPDGDPQTDDAPAVCSNSWGGPQGTAEFEKPYWDMVKTWVRLGIFPCFAAGNSGPGDASIETPGGFPHSFAVGATDARDRLGSFSSRGPIVWAGIGTIKPDACAPGVEVYSARPGGGYQSHDGTSMAAPHVAGVVALIHGAHPGYTVEEISRLLKRTAVDLGPAGQDNAYGSGRIAAFDLLSSAGGAR